MNSAGKCFWYPVAMSDSDVRTRFAPSPTGELHIGNARTALFNWLYARGQGGQFVLRSEDTDRSRSDDTALARMQSDLAWLGIEPDEGPDRGGPFGPYRQRERAPRHGELLQRLLADERAYPCFCTREELATARQRQLAAGKAPRYPGTCAQLTSAEREARRNEGREETIRFRVPDSGTLAFDDLIHGRRQFQLADIGDFVIARADGTPAFFFANAIDDADMAISVVLRGDDHLTNTPRQLLLLEALGLPKPDYGHFGLLTDSAGQPLSKRDGAATLRGLRDQGYHPAALCNHLARVGLSGLPAEWMTADELSAAFRLEQVSRGAAVHDAEALAGWQRRAMERMPTSELIAWIAAAGDREPPWSDAETGAAFAEAIRPNVLFPAQAWSWVERVFGEIPPHDEAAIETIRAAGTEFWQRAQGVAEPAPRSDFVGWAKAVGSATGCRGRNLFRPLRAALTGAVSGPELAELVPLMSATAVERRLEVAARLAASGSTAGMHS